MRMMGGRLRSRDQQGAAAVIVIVSMFVLLGMLVLTMDVGGLLLKHRGLVNANDAAALAAAGSFARGESTLADTTVAKSKADEFAQQNQTDSQREAAPTNDPEGPAPDGFIAKGGIDGSSCDPAKCGTVTVWYAGHTSAFFAQIFGNGKDVTVHERAQAIWGPAGGGQPNPIMVRFDWMQNLCDKPVPPPDDEINITCRFWLDDDGVGDAQWSFLNLISDPSDSHWGWDVPRYDLPTVFPGCTNVASSEVDDWIAQRLASGQLDLNYPDPTYVCRVVGKAANHFPTFKAQEGTFRIFPVNDPNGQVDKNGNLCPPPCTPAKYDIIGFTILRIDLVLKGNDSAATGTQAQTGSCSVTHDFTITAPGNQFDLTTQSCQTNDLHYPGDTTKLYPKLSKKVGPVTTVYQYNVDYRYDATTKVITWINPLPLASVKVEWDWHTPASPGACGVRDSDPNAVCLLASWQGFQTGGINPGDGKDMGLRAVRLSE